MANGKKLLSALAADAAIGLPKLCSTDSHLRLSMHLATLSMTLSSITGLAALTTAFMTLPAILPIMKNIAGMIGIGLCIKTFLLLRDYCETVSTLEAQKVNENLTYPCQYCGSCPVWLAAFDHPDLQTYEDVFEACDDRGCPLVGMEVSDLDLV